MKLLHKLMAVFDRFNDVLAVFGQVLIGFLMITVTYSVVLRYFFDSSVTGLFESWEYSVLYITFLGAAWLLREEGHVSMDLLLTRLKDYARSVINAVTSMVGAIACMTLAWYSTQQFIMIFEQGLRLVRGELYAPKWIIFIIIPLGSYLLSIQFLRRAYKFALKARRLHGEKSMEDEGELVKTIDPLG